MMTYEQAKFRDCISNTSSQFALFAGNKVKVQSVLYKFDAMLVEVELDPAEAGRSQSWMLMKMGIACKASNQLQSLHTTSCQSPMLVSLSIATISSAHHTPC